MTARLYQFEHNREALRGSSERNFSSEPDLSTLTLEMLEPLFKRLSTEDKVQVLRHKVVPVASLPDLTLYAAAGEQAKSQAREHGKRVIANISQEDLRYAIRRKLGRELLAKAVRHLHMRRPEFSAYRRITGLQIFWICISLVWIIAAWAMLDAFYFYAGLSFLCGIFFLSVIALRLLCLMGDNDRRPTPFQELEDDELPEYTILVPVFRETQVLSQLVQSLMRLNYP